MGLSKRVLVLGGGFAGVLAARRIAQGAHDHARVTLISQSDAFVERVRFHEIAAGRSIPRFALTRLLEGTGIEIVHARVESIDALHKYVRLADRSLPYDYLVYALGSSIDIDRVPGVREHCESVADEGSARRLAAALSRGARVLVCGGGMTGVEIATELADANKQLQVRLLTREKPCEPLDARARGYLEQKLARMRIAIEAGVAVNEVRAREAVLDGGTRPFDICIWAASFKVPSLAREAGIATHPSGQLAVDSSLRSISHPEIFGAGDAALPTCTVPIRMGCATAMPMAANAADNIVASIRGDSLDPFRFAYLARFISLGRDDAIAQFVAADDSPTWTMTGRLAAWMKDATFELNLYALHTGIYPWRLSLLGAPALSSDVTLP